MAKYRETAITAADLQEYLEKQDDFALELFVYAKARTLGLKATHGGTYEDPVTKKPRQFDVRAYLERDDTRIDLAIECKSLRPSFPLLVSRIPRIREESFHHVVYSFQLPRMPYAPTVGPPAKTLELSRSKPPLYPLGEFVGKSTTQVGRNDKGDFIAGDSELYDKWTQALGSVDDLIAQAAYYQEVSTSGSFTTAIIPMLVVSDEALWVADYKEEGKACGAPYKVDEALLFVGREYGGPFRVAFTVSHLHICTKTGATQFLGRVSSDDALWERMIPTREVRAAAAEA